MMGLVDSTGALRTRAAQLEGQRFGKLTAIRRVESRSRPLWLCACDCGNEATVAAAKLRSGWTRSCGCLRREASTHGNSHKTHGLKPTSEYTTWGSMKQRCFDVGCKGYPRYGGRGITVCDRWRDSFENFLADMGPKPSSESTIDRINSNGNYEPSNCRWASRFVQARNRPSFNVMLTHNGVTRCMGEWALIIGVKPSTIAQRLRRGWTVELALSTSTLPYGVSFEPRGRPVGKYRALACMKGHPYAEHGAVRPNGTRVCRICELARSRKSDVTRKALRRASRAVVAA